MSEKMKKKRIGDIIILHIVPKIMITWCTMDWQMYGWTDRQTDRQKKWHIEVGAPPKNNPQLIEAKIKIRKLMDVNI